MLEPAEVVATTSNAYNLPSITVITKWIPEMDSACKTTPKTNLNRKFLTTFIFAQISIAPYSVTGLFFFFLESIRLINLRLCGAPVPSPLKVWYTDEKTGYINVLPFELKKGLKK